MSTQSEGGALTNDTLAALNTVISAQGTDATNIATNTANIATNTASIAALSQFGSGGLAIKGEGNVSVQISAVGLSPAATGADKVIAVLSIPANSFDAAGRGMVFRAIGSFGNNTNSKQVKIIFNCTTAVVGQTVTGGTTIVDSGAWTTTGATPFMLQAQVFKYGAANSNTQMAHALSAFPAGAGVSVTGAKATPTATENAVILVAVTGNADTTAGDIVLNLFTVNGQN